MTASKSKSVSKKVTPQQTNRRGNPIVATSTTSDKGKTKEPDYSFWGIDDGVHEVIEETKRSTPRYSQTDLELARVKIYAIMMSAAALGLAALAIWR